MQLFSQLNLKIDSEVMQQVTKKYPFKITRHLDRLITNSCSAALKKQFYPSPEEITLNDGYDDPIGDRTHSPVPRLVHRYPDRVILFVTKECFAYCRFCFRKAIVGSDSGTLNNKNLEEISQYLEANKNIREVILTGGDPLFVDNSELKRITGVISKISSIDVIRIHTRAPIVNPERIDNQLLKILKHINKALFMVVHANHPDEFTPEVALKLKKIIAAGIPVLSQSVLLKGINDSIEVMAELMRTFIKNRIKPYYLHNCDLAKGNCHFRVDIKKGQELMKHLHYNNSGLCQPVYILDIPGGFGKVPVGPVYLEEGAKKWLITDPRGKIHSFPGIHSN